MTTAAIIAAGETRAALVATLPRTQLIRGVDMTEAITWGPERKHDGSSDCPAEARDVRCVVYTTDGQWTPSEYNGVFYNWRNIIAYRLPVTPTDHVRDALVEALEKAIAQLEKVHDDALNQARGHGLCTSDGRAFSCMELNRCSDVATELRAVLALAKGEKP